MSLNDLIKEYPACELNRNTGIPNHRTTLEVDHKAHYVCCDSRNCIYKNVDVEVHRHGCNYDKAEKLYCK